MFCSRVLLFAIFVGICAGYPAKHVKPVPASPRTEVLFERGYDKEAIGN